MIQQIHEINMNIVMGHRQVFVCGLNCKTGRAYVGIISVNMHFQRLFMFGFLVSVFLSASCKLLGTDTSCNHFDLSIDVNTRKTHVKNKLR